MPLFLAMLWVPTAVTSLILGSSFIRRRLGRFSRYWGYRNRWRQIFASVFGSVILQAVFFDIIAAGLLAGPSTDITNIYWAWFIRPLPGTIVLFLSLTCVPVFIENAIEIQITEIIMSIFTIKIYTDIEMSTRDPIDLDGFWSVRYGSILGIVAWTLTLVVFLGCVLASFVVSEGDTLGKVMTRWGVFFNIVGMACGMSIWIGVAKMDPTAFCPSSSVGGGIAALWIFTTVVDHLWRALFCVGRVKWISGKLASSYHAADTEWPLDVTTEKKLLIAKSNQRQGQPQDSYESSDSSDEEEDI